MVAEDEFILFRTNKVKKKSLFRKTLEDFTLEWSPEEHFGVEGDLDYQCRTNGSPKHR